MGGGETVAGSSSGRSRTSEGHEHEGVRAVLPPQKIFGIFLLEMVHFGAFHACVFPTQHGMPARTSNEKGVWRSDNPKLRCILRPSFKARRAPPQKRVPTGNV